MSELERKIEEAQFKAMDSLARYKFMQFGYWAAIWIHLSRLDGKKRQNPFKKLVWLAKLLRDFPGCDIPIFSMKEVKGYIKLGRRA